MYIIDPRTSPAKVYEFNPRSEIKNNPYLQTLQRQIDPRTLKAIFRHGQAALDKLVAAGSNRVVWTSTGALYGNQSNIPCNHFNHFWGAIGDAFPAKKNERYKDQLMRERAKSITAGSIVKVLIGERQEQTWIGYKKETERHDIVSGKEIWTNEYFIVHNFVPPTPKKAKGFGVNDLKNKWNATSRA